MLQRACSKLAARDGAHAALAVGVRGALAADPEQGAAPRDLRHRDARPAAVSTTIPSSQVVAAIFEGLYEWDYLGSPAQTRAGHRHRAAGDHRRRQDVDDAPPARHPLHRRSGLRRQAARAGRRGHRLFDEARARSEPQARRHRRPSPTSSSARARWSTPPSKAGAKFDYDRPIEGLRAIDRYTRAAAPDRVQLSRSSRASSPRRGGARSRRSRGRRHPHARRSGPARTSCANGGTARASCSMPIPTIGRSAFPESDDPRDAGAGAQHAGRHAAADRRRRNQRHRRRAHAPAAIRARQARLRRAHRGDRRARGWRTASSSPSTSREA